MKKIWLAIAVFIVVFIIFVGIWWYKSNELVVEVSNAINRISNEKEYPYTIKYDQLQSSGFPFSSQFIFTNPVLIAKDNSSKVIHHGILTIGSSIFEKDKLWVDFKGEMKIYPKNDNGAHFIINGETYLECLICTKNILLFKDIAKGFYPRIELLSLLLNNSTVKFKDLKIVEISKTEKPFDLLKVNKAYFHLDNKIKEKFNHFNLHIDIKNMWSTSLDALEKFHQIFPASTKEEIRKAFFDIGPYNLTFAAHGFVPTLDHPFFQHPDLADIPSFEIVIDKSLYAGNLDSHVSNGQLKFKNLLNNSFKALIKSNEHWTATEKMHGKLSQIVDVIAKKEASDPHENSMKKKLAELIEVNKEDLVPDLAKFGTVNFVLDVEGEGEKKGNKIEHAKVDLEEFKLSCSLYGIECLGKLEEKDDDNFSSFLEIRIRNYKSLFSDMAFYYNKWQRIFVNAHYTTAIQMPIISQVFVDRFVQFLVSLSISKDSTLLDVPIYYEDPERIKIGIKSFHDARLAWDQLMIDLNSEVIKANPPTKG